MKKTLTSYFLFFTGMCVVFTICYYFSYQRALKQFMAKTEERDYQIMMELRNASAGAVNYEAQYTSSGDSKSAVMQSDAMEVGSTDVEILKPGSKYVIESYDVVTNELITAELAIPGEYVGLTRDEIIRKLSDYMKDVPISEYEKGLFSYELVSFAKDSVTVRKNYNSDLIQFKYYVAVRDSYVIVYYSDLKTVYEYTRILAIELPETERERLMHGIYLKTNDELYELLESYSS